MYNLILSSMLSLSQGKGRSPGIYKQPFLFISLVQTNHISFPAGRMHPQISYKSSKNPESYFRHRVLPFKTVQYMYHVLT